MKNSRQKIFFNKKKRNIPQVLSEAIFGYNSGLSYDGSPR